MLLLQGDAEGYLRGVAHASHGQEVVAVAFAPPFTNLKEFAGDHARRRHHGGLCRQGLHHGLDGFLATERQCAVHLALQGVSLEGIFLNDQRIGFVGACHVVHGGGNLLGGLSLVLAQHAVVDAHRVEQSGGHLALLDVLRLVVHTGTASPSDEQQHGNVVHFAVGERCQRVDDVSLAGVLHIHHTNLPR